MGGYWGLRMFSVFQPQIQDGWCLQRGWQGSQNHLLALQLTGVLGSKKLSTGFPRNGALNSQGTECLRSKQGDTAQPWLQIKCFLGHNPGSCSLV